MNTTTIKKMAACTYLTICMLAMCVELNDSVSMGKFIAYYSIVLANFIWAALILKRLYTNENSRNRN